jgi:hypothetical protein
MIGKLRPEKLGWAVIAVLVAIHSITLVLLFLIRGLPQPTFDNAWPIVVGFSGYFALGVAGFGIYRFLRGEKERWLATVRRPSWWGESALLILAASLISLGYTTLKIAVPLISSRRYDALLWEIDRWSLLGISPNILAVELIPYPAFFTFIDLTYGTAFGFTLLISFSIILGHESRRLRIAWVLGSAVLWLGGAWLYLALPSLGPVFVFHDVWDDVRHMMPNAMEMQVRLIENYLRVIGFKAVEPGRAVSLFYGVAAFPSMHLGFHSFVACWLGRLLPRARVAGWLVVSLMFVGSIVTGWHYMIDSIAGILLGWIAYRIAVAIVSPDRDFAAEEEGMMRGAPAPASQ